MEQHISTPVSELPKKRVAVYYRQENPHLCSNMLSENRLQEIKTYIDSVSDWELTAVYSDPHPRSSSIKARPGFRRLMDDAVAGEFDCLVVRTLYDIASRFTPLWSHCHQLMASNIEIITINEPIDFSDPMVETFLAAMTACDPERSHQTA